MKYRKKTTVVIDAIQWTGNNIRMIRDFVGVPDLAETSQWNEFDSGLPDGRKHKSGLKIMTLEGPLIVTDGDWIIKDVKGEFYPVKDEIFASTYDPIS